jgi:SSS family solute:Na+ symporter
MFPILGNQGTESTLYTDNTQELFRVANGPNFWVSVHAMEYLAKLGLKKEASQLARSNLKSFQGTPQKRIGYWRVKSMSSRSLIPRTYWMHKIKKAYLDKSGPDRIHAAESLAKLGVSFNKINQVIVLNDLKSEGMLYSFCHWGYSLPKNRGEVPNYSAFMKEIKNENLQRRSLAAYALGFLTTNMNKDSWDTLASITLKEKPNSEAYVRLIAAAYVHYNPINRDSWATFQVIKERLLQLENSPKKSERIELCKALALSTFEHDLPIIERILFSLKRPKDDSTVNAMALDSGDPEYLDLKAAASFAWLKRNSTIDQ